jgi:hypothetical protein
MAYYFFYIQLTNEKDENVFSIDECFISAGPVQARA